MVAGLSRLESTIRSRSWPSDQRAPAPLRSGARCALEPLLRERPGVAEQAEADLAVGDDGAAARRIALGAGQRRRDRVADDRIGTQRGFVRRQRPAAARCSRSERSRQRAMRGEPTGRGAAQPNTSAVMVLNQPSAKLASAARGRARRIRRADAAGAFDVGELAVAPADRRRRPRCRSRAPPGCSRC